MACCHEKAAKIILHSPSGAFRLRFLSLGLNVGHLVPDATLVAFVGEETLERCLQTGLPSVVMKS
jgi:hypothetical protein